MCMRATILTLSLFFVTASFLPMTAFAAQVKAANAKKVLIELENDSFKVGDILNIKNDSGKVVGITKITRIKGQLAEGLLKGKATKGFQLSLRPPKSKTAQPKSSGNSQAAAQEDDEGKSGGGDSSSDSLKMMIGGLFGYNSSKMDATLPSTNTDVALSGSGFSLKALLDVPFFSWASFRGLAGFEQLNVDGANECSGTCKVEITYITADFWARYMINMNDGPIKPWVGAGFSVMFPMSKDATAIAESSITNTNTFSLGGGVDWGLQSGSYIPLQLEYNLYPSTDSVKTTAITFRGGYAMTY